MPVPTVLRKNPFDALADRFNVHIWT
jgi:hypothetical protein